MEVLIVGAGVSGLACARELKRAGFSATVLERGRSVGGRCSSRRTDDGHILDHGVTYYHGESERFLEALREVDATRLEGWPQRVKGRGTACQPQAFSPRSTRVAFVEGSSAFPKFLARGLNVRNGAVVEGVEADADRFSLRIAGAEARQTHHLVLAMPTEQMLRLLRPLEGIGTEFRGACRLLSELPTVPCLTVLATYGDAAGREEAAASDPCVTGRAADVEWDLMLPESEVLQLVSRESSKRPDVPGDAFVVQAAAGWSAGRVEDDPAEWSAALLSEAAGIIGDWFSRPAWSRPHRWRFARTDIGGELAGPMILRAGDARIGLCGESFHRGAGVEAAYLSGVAMARRLIEEESTDG